MIKNLRVEFKNTCPSLPRATEKNLNKLLPKVAEEFESFFKDKIPLKLNGQIQLAVTICGNQKIKSLNHSYRNLNKVTDVLSFPIYPDLRNGDLDGQGSGNKSSNHELQHFPLLELGDIYICLSKAQSQAKEFKLPLHCEIVYLLIHGFLHLLGFDHELSVKEQKLMEKYEDQLYLRISK